MIWITKNLRNILADVGKFTKLNFKKNYYVLEGKGTYLYWKLSNGGWKWKKR